MRTPRSPPAPKTTRLTGVSTATNGMTAHRSVASNGSAAAIGAASTPDARDIAPERQSGAVRGDLRRDSAGAHGVGSHAARLSKLSDVLFPRHRAGGRA